MTEHTGNQSTIDYFTHVEKTGDEYRCRVCGRTAEKKSVVKHCHPQSRLSRTRDSGVTEKTVSHQGFVYPRALHSAVREFFTTVENAIQNYQTTPLWPATEVILEEAGDHEFYSQRVRVFAHLVFLQQHQVLPGYPVTVEASDTNTVSLERFIAETDQVEGAVTADELAASNAITQERIYRANVYSTTDEFVLKSQILPDSLWAWQTERTILNEIVTTDVIFGDSTAHNAVTARVCTWLSTHPDIDWTCAPHVMTTAIGEQYTTLHDDIEAEPPTPEPTMMFDFAGFRESGDQQLAVVGFVIEGETLPQIGELLIRAARPKTACLMVLPNRDAIIDCIRYAHSEGIFKGDIAPTQDVGEYYKSRPSISHINAELAERGSNTANLRFLSRKQVIDGFVDPVSALPDTLPPSQE